MGAYKQFCHECAEEGKIPLTPVDLKILVELRDDSDEYVEIVKHQYTGFDGSASVADCLTIDSAIGLQDLGYKIDFIDDFIDIWQDVIFDYCDECGCERQWVVEDNRRFCTDCE